jgi:iron complex outermembrane receptor protein
LGLDWRLSSNDTLSLQIQQRAVVEKKAQSFITARVNANYDAIGTSDYTQSRGTTGRFEMGTLNPSNYDATTDTSLLSLRYQHRGPVWNIEGQASYSVADRERSSLGKGYFNGVLANPSTSTFAAMASGRVRASGRKPIRSPAPTARFWIPTMPTITPSAPRTRSMPLYQTDLTSGRLNVSRAIGRNLSIKIGGAYNRLDKDDTRPVKNYTFVGRASGQTAVSLVRHRG